MRAQNGEGNRPRLPHTRLTSRRSGVSVDSDGRHRGTRDKAGDDVGVFFPGAIGLLDMDFDRAAQAVGETGSQRFRGGDRHGLRGVAAEGHGGTAYDPRSLCRFAVRNKQLGGTRSHGNPRYRWVDLRWVDLTKTPGGAESTLRRPAEKTR